MKRNLVRFSPMGFFHVRSYVDKPGNCYRENMQIWRKRKKKSKTFFCCSCLFVCLAFETSFFLVFFCSSCWRSQQRGKAQRRRGRKSCFFNTATAFVFFSFFSFSLKRKKEKKFFHHIKTHQF